MCGIGGFFSFETLDRVQSLEWATKMLVDLEERGIDATGVAVIDTQMDKIKILKFPIEASDFVQTVEFEDIFLNNKYNLVLLHTRQGTGGTPKKSKNNHPVYDKQGNAVIIHNGYLYNDTELIKKYHFKIDGKVDTEVILKMFLKKGITAIKEINGSLTFGLYHDGKLYLSKRKNPLHLLWAKAHNVFLFSSIEESINELFIERVHQYFIFSEKKATDKLLSADLCNESVVTIDFDTESFDIAIIEEDDYYPKKTVYVTRASTNPRADDFSNCDVGTFDEENKYNDY